MSGSRPRLATLPTFALAAVLALVGAACGAAFDPSGPCTTDGRAAGAYPSLEAMVPRELDGRAATRVDSGRNCTAAALGSLATHDVTELRYAGSTWDTGPNGGVTLAIFEAPNLRADWVHEFYKSGAESGRNTEQVTAATVDIGGRTGYRVDTLNGESYQTVVDWQDGDRVRVVLVASFIRDVPSKADHDDAVGRAIATALAADAQ
jgi:hypothetical protein